MYFSCGKKGLISALALALAALTMTARPVSAGPDPAARRPTGKYRLFAGNLGAISVNQVVYGFTTVGEIGVDSTGSSTVGGGFWPKGTGNQYMFNSGLEVAGVIQGTKPNNPWAGDTTGGFFFDASGTVQQGSPVTEFQNSNSPIDRANWPQAAFVPQGDFSEDIFDPVLRGRISASQGDVWFMSRETDPALTAGRPHPLGIVAETRVLGWNFPAGNQDLIYVVATVYNVTTTNPAAYAQYRPGLREILIEQANLFATSNNAAFNITLPSEGYTIDPMFVSYSADPDVSNSAGTNFATVNLPFSMAIAYHADFFRAPGWTFDPAVFGPPFFAGAGFVGMKYLKGPSGDAKVQLYSNRTNGGAFPDPRTVVKLFKYMEGSVTPADGVSCNTGDPALTNICFIGTTAADVRSQLSAEGFALPAGGAASMVVGYVHAAPVQVPGYLQGTRVQPGDATLLSDAVRLTLGANLVDSISGFNGFTDGNGDGEVQQSETNAIPKSLLAKALIAQTIFDNKFLLPFAPEAPDFFLIPGNEQVTVVWRPSATETDGDPFFNVAGSPTTIPAGGGAPITNLLFDPNYRQFDVEGYRVYRGRSNNPSTFRLLASFDYAGTTFRDFRGAVVSDEIGNACSPEPPLSLTTSCPGVFSVPVPGVAPTLFVDYPLVGKFIQTSFGDQKLLADGTIFNAVTDTAVVGGGSGFPDLDDTGVPFAFLDQSVRNGLRYFYAVTAFDVNSVVSTGLGNTSLESARISKSVTPNTTASNHVNSATTQNGIFGRSGLLTDNVAPTIDPVTGRFDKKHLPSNGASVSLAAFVQEVLTGSGQVSLSLDSIVPISFAGASSVTADYFLSVDTPLGTTKVTERRVNSSTSGIGSGGGSFPALEADGALAARFDAPTGAFGLGGTFTTTWPGLYYQTISSRGCVNFAAGFPSGTGCAFNGPRWFSGNNETKDHPNSSNMNRFRTTRDRLDFNNAGELPGVTTVFIARAYDDYAASWRDAEAIMGTFASTGDFRVYWGAAGVIDSVIDLTHDVVVPFSPNLGPTWGILNSAATQATGYPDQRLEIAGSDIGCVEPLRTLNPSSINCTAPPAQLSQTAIPFPVVYSNQPAGLQQGSFTTDRTAQAKQPGFLLYLKGYSFVVELAGGALPAAGTQWTMRTYTGAIGGGMGRETDVTEPYVFTTQSQPRPFNVLGARASFAFDVVNETVAASKEGLKKIHTVPDPYYVTSQFEATTSNKIIKFVNLPTKATIRIYTVSGILVRVLKHDSDSFSGEITWDVRNRNNTFVASGVYFYHVTADNGETVVGRMTIVNFAN